jgi:hypothetical protein
MNIPSEVFYNGGVSYRWYPGGVECRIEYPSKDYRLTATSFVPCEENEVEKYDREELAERAYKLALSKV